MLIQLNALNARVVDVPTSTLYGREVSDVKVGRVVFTFPPQLIAAGISRFWRKQHVTNFGPIGGLTIAGLALCIFGAVFGAYHWWLSSVSQRPATAGTVMIAVLPLIVGIHLIMQAFALSVDASPDAQQTAEYTRELIRTGELGPPPVD